MAEISRGIVSLRAARAADSVMQLDKAIGRLEATGHRIWIRYLRGLQGEGRALTGDLDGARALIDESVLATENGEERVHYAELLRLRGWVLMLQGRPDEAEAALRASIDVARAQTAKSWSFAAPRRSPACWSSARIAHRRARCCRTCAGGSPKGSAPRISRRRKPSWTHFKSDRNLCAASAPPRQSKGRAANLQRPDPARCRALADDNAELVALPVARFGHDLVSAWGSNSEVTASSRLSALLLEADASQA